MTTNQYTLLPSLLITFVSFLPLPATANSVSIPRYSTEGDQVALRVKVLDDNNVPIEGLTKNNFKISTTDKEGNFVNSSTLDFDLVSPEKQSESDTTYVVILLDMSGSMKNNDLGGRPKLTGAIQAIKKFIQKSREDNLSVKIALAPFGYKGGSSCNSLYEVDEDTIEKESPFIDVNSKSLNDKLQNLSHVSVCASTDLYKPLVAATSYLRKQVKQNNSIFDTAKTPPRLMAILLSDGYDNSNEARTQNLTEILKQQPQITVHTLGYGESLRQLRDRATCRQFISDDKLTPQTIRDSCHLKQEGDINEFIIDEHQLKQIAQSTGGIYELSSNADAVAKSLTGFLKTLREYELIYKQPGAERAKTYKTLVTVNSPSRRLNNVSAEENIHLKNIDYKPLPLLPRLSIFTLTTLLGLVGALGFRQWSKQLKEQAERYLE